MLRVSKIEFFRPAVMLLCVLISFAGGSNTQLQASLTSFKLSYLITVAATVAAEGIEL